MIFFIPAHYVVEVDLATRFLINRSHIFQRR